jgi:hypothetical protein
MNYIEAVKAMKYGKKVKLNDKIYWCDIFGYYNYNKYTIQIIKSFTIDAKKATNWEVVE